MSYKLIPLSKEHAVADIPDDQLHLLQRVLDLLLGSMVPKDHVVTFHFEQTKDNDITIRVICNRMPWFVKKDRIAIGQIAAKIGRLQQYDFSWTLLEFSVKHREISAHDVIEDRSELRAIADTQGADWPSISAAYDDVVSRMRQKRSTISA
jgi:hypothetical protein